VCGDVIAAPFWTPNVAIPASIVGCLEDGDAAAFQHPKRAAKASQGVPFVLYVAELCYDIEGVLAANSIYYLRHRTFQDRVRRQFLPRKLHSARAQLNSSHFKMARGKHQKTAITGPEINQLSAPFPSQSLGEHVAIGIGAQRAQQARKGKHDRLRLLAPRNFLGIFLEPIVIFRLRGIIEFAAKEYHRTTQAFDNFPLVAPQNYFSIHCTAQRARADRRTR